MLNIKKVSKKLLSVLLCSFFISCSVLTSDNQNSLCPCKLLTDDSVSKLILVKSFNETYAKIYLMEKEINKSTNKAYWKKVGFFNGRIGRNGIVDANEKREGDRKTPTGIYNLKDAFGINKIDIKIPYRVLDGTEYWVDDINSKYYNTMQFVKAHEKPYFNSAEHLADIKVEYQYAMVIDYNEPPIPGKGSAIFLHVENNKATGGCVAVSKENMIRILNWVDEGKTKILIK